MQFHQLHRCRECSRCITEAFGSSDVSCKCCADSFVSFVQRAPFHSGVSGVANKPFPKIPACTASQGRDFSCAIALGDGIARSKTRRPPAFGRLRHLLRSAAK